MAILFHIDDWQSIRERVLHQPIWRPALLWLHEQYEHPHSIQPGEQEIKTSTVRLATGITQVKCHTDPAAPFEAHRKNVDVHCCFKGEEAIHYASVSQATALDLAEQPAPDSDTTLYAVETPHSVLYLLPGYVAIFFPEDAHRPLQAKEPLKSCPVTKAIIKIPLAIL